MKNFICQICGAKFPSWVGRCSECGNWNCVVEDALDIAQRKKSFPKTTGSKTENKPLSLSEIPLQSEERISSKIEEFDRVLGGGIVKGAVVLFTGEPGIGKSTLLLQIADILSKKEKILYVSGEESLSQIKIRAKRLNINSENLLILTATDVFDIENYIKSTNPALVIIDSIQTLEIESASSSAGSISQVRESCLYLTQVAKTNNIPLIIVGQITKDGSVAGPKMLEHMVDAVLYFEGDKNRPFRIIRSVKNRFGSTNEVGIFEMKIDGLKEVKNPSQLLIDETSIGLPGSVITCLIEGSRPILVEIQSLVSYSKLPYPKRVFTGLDFNRVSVIIGVLEKKIGLKLSENDIYLNIASGIYSEDPAIDLPIAISISSCVKNKGLDSKTIVLGEIGLTGEVRAVPNLDQRLNESIKLGFKKAVIPLQNRENGKTFNSLELIKVASIKEAFDKLFS